jgi:RNA polymerase sigma-70 factor (ECF subfamily)
VLPSTAAFPAAGFTSLRVAMGTQGAGALPPRREGEGLTHRAATPCRRSSGVSGEGAAVRVPAPSTARDDEPGSGEPPTEHPAAEGDAAVALALVHRAQAGDADAFGELYDRYVDLVYRYVYYRVGTPALAEDLTSETFLRALRRITSFTWQGRDVGAWFVTIARNLIADHYKSGRYRLELTTDDVGESGAAARMVEEGPEGAVLESMQNAVLLEAVKQLNPEQQECIVLRFLQGMSVAETALAMGKNDGAVKALQYRAIRSLGRLLPEGVEL